MIELLSFEECSTCSISILKLHKKLLEVKCKNHLMFYLCFPTDLYIFNNYQNNISRKYTVAQFLQAPQTNLKISPKRTSRRQAILLED